MQSFSPPLYSLRVNLRMRRCGRQPTYRCWTGLLRRVGQSTQRPFEANRAWWSPAERRVEFDLDAECWRDRPHWTIFRREGLHTAVPLCRSIISYVAPASGLEQEAYGNR